MSRLIRFFADIVSPRSPETIVILRSVATFEKMYLARTNNRINEAINTAYAGGSRQPPGANDGVTIGRIMVNELDAARIDPLLSWSVARAVGQSIDYIVSKSSGLVSSRRCASFLDFG